MGMKDVAITAAMKAGGILLELSKIEIKHQMKGTHDIVAEADLKTENAIISEIRKHFTSHSILSEEAGDIPGNPDHLWVIDPLDGTINFSRSIEEYCTSIAVEHKGQLVLGVIYQPTTDRLFVAEKDKGAFLNGKKLSVSNGTNNLRAEARRVD